MYVLRLPNCCPRVVSKVAPQLFQCVPSVFQTCFYIVFQSLSNVILGLFPRVAKGVYKASQQLTEGAAKVVSAFPEGVSKALTGLAQGFHMACAVCSNEFSSFTKVVPRLSQCIFTL